MGSILNLVSFARTVLLNTLHVNLYPKIFIIICKNDHITNVVNCPTLMKEQKGKWLKFLRGMF